jgi:hypothetical protein
MLHGRNDLGQRVVDGVDLVIDFATLGEYGLQRAWTASDARGQYSSSRGWMDDPGLEPTGAEGSARQRTDRRPRPDRRPGWEAPARAPRSACGASTRHVASSLKRKPDRHGADQHPEWRFPGTRPTRANFRAAVDRYSS